MTRQDVVHEPVDPRDEVCDYCGRQVFDRYFRRLNDRWLCSACYEREAAA